MQRPYLNFSKPQKHDYEQQTEEVDIYVGIVPLWDDEFSYREDEDKDDEDEQEDYLKFTGYRNRHPILKNPPIEEMSLQKLIDLVPDNVKLSDIKFSINSKYSDTGPSPSPSDTQYIRFYYLKTFPPNLEQYEKDLDAFNKEYSEYEKKKLEYDMWEKEQELVKKQKELAYAQEQFNKLKK